MTREVVSTQQALSVRAAAARGRCVYLRRNAWCGERSLLRAQVLLHKSWEVVLCKTSSTSRRAYLCALRCEAVRRLAPQRSCRRWALSEARRAADSPPRIGQSAARTSRVHNSYKGVLCTGFRTRIGAMLACARFAKKLCAGTRRSDCGGCGTASGGRRAGAKPGTARVVCCAQVEVQISCEVGFWHLSLSSG